MRYCFLFVPFFAIGCTPVASHFPEKVESPPPESLAGEFQSDECGLIRGRVMRDGQPMSGAVVWLKVVDPRKSKPWPELAPVRIIATDSGLECSSSSPFVRHGQSIEFESQRGKPNVIRGRGAMNLAVPLHEHGSKTSRLAQKPGRVDFTSGAIQPDARVTVFVCSHPYFTTTDKDGRFSFADVPNGSYEVMAWAFNDRVIGHDRDPESEAITRKQYAPAWESTGSITVARQKESTCELVLTSPE